MYVYKDKHKISEYQNTYAFCGFLFVFKGYQKLFGDEKCGKFYLCMILKNRYSRVNMINFKFILSFQVITQNKFGRCYKVEREIDVELLKNWHWKWFGISMIHLVWIWCGSINVSLKISTGMGGLNFHRCKQKKGFHRPFFHPTTQLII